MIHKFLEFGFLPDELTTVEKESVIKFHPRIFDLIREQYDKRVSNGTNFNDCAGNIVFNKPTVRLLVNHGRGYACIHYLLVNAARKLKKDKKLAKKQLGSQALKILNNLKKEVKSIIPIAFFERGGKVKFYYDHKNACYVFIMYFWKGNYPEKIKLTNHDPLDHFEKIKHTISYFC